MYLVHFQNVTNTDEVVDYAVKNHKTLKAIITTVCNSDPWIGDDSFNLEFHFTDEQDAIIFELVYR